MKKLISVFMVLCLLALPTMSFAQDRRVYVFSGIQLAKPCGNEDVSDVKLTDDITVTTGGKTNWKTAAVTDIEHNKDCGYYPIGDGFKASGSYIFLGAGPTDNDAVFSLNLETISKGSSVTLTYAKPIITNNGGTRRNESDPYAYFKIADRYICINGGKFDEWRTESVVTGEDTDKIDFCCDKWGAVAIERIEIDDAASGELHTLFVNASRYANLTVNGIKMYAPFDGKLSAGVFEEGEEIEIKAEKDGYEDTVETVVMENSDMTAQLSQECTSDAYYYESDFGNKSGELTLDTYSLDIPARDITKFFGEATFEDGGNITFTADGADVFKIVKNSDGIYANDTKITSKDNMQFEVYFDKTLHIVTLKQNDTLYTPDKAFDGFESLDSISGEGVTMDYLGASYPDETKIEIIGPDNVSASEGYTTKVKYSAAAEYEIEGAEVVFNTDGGENASISEDGELSLTSNADGILTITAEYNGEMAYKEIHVTPRAKIAKYSFPCDTLNLGSYVTAEIYDVQDEFGNDITGCAELRDFTSSDESVISINELGVMSAVGVGKATVTFNAYTGTDNTVSHEYTVSAFSSGGAAAKDAVVYEPNVFGEDERISAYKYTDSDGSERKIEETQIPAVEISGAGVLITAKYEDGVLAGVSTEAVAAGDKATVSDDGKKRYFADSETITELTEPNTTMPGFEIQSSGAAYEITPIYTFNDVGDVSGEGVTLDVPFENGFYDITFKKAETRRGDIYVNGYMVANNVDQADADRKVSDGALYTAEDVAVNDGKITVSMTDGSTVLDYVTVEKSGKRGRRLYIIGDSLACIYYGSFEQEVGGGRSGWGQQIGSFLNIPVTDLANSGQYAAGLYKTAFPGVIHNAEPGDILLIECAYNDRNYSTREEMTSCVKAMIAECGKNGITPILVTPNASKHDYKPSVAWSGYLRDIAEDENCEIIDLSKISYDFLYALYGDDTDNVVTMNYNLTAVGGDTLHSSYAGAYMWASMVAQGLKDLGYGDIVNADYKYTFTDTLGNELTAEIK